MINIDLSPDRFLGAVAGLRPFRTPAPRLELEVVGGKSIAHNYGHGGSGITMCWGAAREAIALLESQLDSPRSVAVLGAGVMGLCAATLLVGAGHQVRIYARDLPQQTTSRIAGGLWAPTHVGAGANRQETARHERILRHTWQTFRALDPARFGIVEAPLYETDDRAFALDAMPEGLSSPPRRLEQMPFPGDLGPGQVSTTLLVITPKFLGEMEQRLRSGGAVFVERSFKTPADLMELEEELIVNCLGLGARQACEDRNLVPIRGQLALFQPLEESFMLDHSQGYVISRPDLLILGGTFEHSEESCDPVPATIDEIVNQHRNVFHLTA